MILIHRREIERDPPLPLADGMKTSVRVHDVGIAVSAPAELAAEI